MGETGTNEVRTRVCPSEGFPGSAGPARLSGPGSLGGRRDTVQKESHLLLSGSPTHFPTSFMSVGEPDYTFSGSAAEGVILLDSAAREETSSLMIQKQRHKCMQLIGYFQINSESKFFTTHVIIES